jgi:hypothetical protein
MRVVLFVAIMIAGALFYTSSALSQQQPKPQPQLPPLRLGTTQYWCPDLEKFIKWIAESNKYGPILLEEGVIENYGCKTKVVTLISNKLIGVVRAFNVPVLAIEAQAANEGTVYTFVPILPSLPFEPGIGA